MGDVGRKGGAVLSPPGDAGLWHAHAIAREAARAADLDDGVCKRPGWDPWFKLVIFIKTKEKYFDR